MVDLILLRQLILHYNDNYLIKLTETTAEAQPIPTPDMNLPINRRALNVISV